MLCPKRTRQVNRSLTDRDWASVVVELSMQVPTLSPPMRYHIPTGKRLRVQLLSADVIHSFWVARLARKMDAIPGRENFIWLQADEPGVYQGRCANSVGLNMHG